MNYDIANAFTYGQRDGSASEDLRFALPFAACIHLKDVIDTPTGWNFCAIGDGSIGYPDLMDLLRSLALTVPMAMELPLRLSRPGKQDLVRAAVPPLWDDIRAALLRSKAFVSPAMT